VSQEILLPELAESVTEGEIVRWIVPEGAPLKKDQPFVEVMTDKVTVELPSPYEGVLVKQLAREGEVVKVHSPIALVETEAAAAEAKPQAQEPKEERSLVEPGEDLSLFRPDPRPETIRNPFQTQAPGRVLAVPAARKLARELGVNLENVQGSGPGGRIRVEDVQRAAQAAQAQAPAPTPTPAPSQPPAPYRAPKGYEALEERIPLRGIRRAIAQQMVASHLLTVRTLTVDEADFSALMALRERLKPEAERQGVKLSYLPFIFKALVRSLKQYPSLNSSLDEEKQEIVRKHHYHFGMAVDTEQGLIVPVIRDVDRKSPLELAREIQDIAERARAGKLSPDETSGSTFSVTNIGPIGALFSFPIINIPDAAILGVHTIQRRPVVRGDEIVIRPMMYLSLSFDHRLVDGAEAARFCRTLIRLLEDPDLLFLEA
jgi:2-oxoisovalerate dehydrogenase E2 component (dihydrolipoyl transacylase)